MPSPKGNGMKVLIRPTAWLEPVTGEPLDIPPEIPPGTTCYVPGILRAYIKNEFKPRPHGTTLQEQDFINLVAYSQRLRRVLPEFRSNKPVTYQYPLRITAVPKYLDCAVEGETLRISWTVSACPVFPPC